MSKIFLYVWGLGFKVWGFGFGVLGFGGVVGGLVGWCVVRTLHTLVKSLLIKFLMMLFLVAKGCKFDSCVIIHPPHTGTFKSNNVYHVSTVSMLANTRGIYNK